MDLNQPITALKGVGEKTAKDFARAGVLTIRDLLYSFPRVYDDLMDVSRLSEIRPGNVQVIARLKACSTRYARSRKMSITEGVIEDGTGEIRVIWFNQAYREKQLVKGREYVFMGKFELNRGRYQLMSPRVVELRAFLENAEGELEREKNKIMPVYPAKAGIKTEKWRKIIMEMRARFFEIPDLLPKGIGVREGVRKKALYLMHFPEKKEQVKRAREYLAFEELFVWMLAAKLNKSSQGQMRGSKVEIDLSYVKMILAKLPFELTNAQKRATWDILKDLDKKMPMNRLLQGDVGSGKTVVAAIVAAQVARKEKDRREKQDGGQVAILAPTAILATQHAKNLRKMLEPLGVRVELLISATKNKTKLKERIKNGEVDVVIGTHAILTDDTKFLNLELCIIDEQHRFGVMQRQRLLLKTNGETAPHLLSMTATPIPRSLQLVLFGDLDVSIIDEMPKNRKIVETEIINELQTREVLYKKIREKVTAGEQVYWICKSILENDVQEDFLSVEKQAKVLRGEFPDLKIAMLYGKMKPAEKEQVMQDFLDKKIDILVSTTVVEVGVDVPNATLMIISNAEMYGLAQLHQLRGRVGRGEKASQCFLVASGEAGPPKRLLAMKKFSSGFMLAEIDLKERGPGEIYGSLQHGVLDFKIADFADIEMINKASSAVQKFLQSGDDVLKYEELALLLKKYQQLTTLN